MLITLWLDVLFVMSGFTKNAWALAKKYFLQKLNIKNGNVVTANCNVFNETLHPWNFFVFFSPHLWMSGFVEWTINDGVSQILKQVPKSVSKSNYH